MKANAEKPAVKAEPPQKAEQPHEAMPKQPPLKEDEKGPGGVLRQKTKVAVLFNFTSPDSIERSFKGAKGADFFFTLLPVLISDDRRHLLEELGKGGVRIIPDMYADMEYADNGFTQRSIMHDKAIEAAKRCMPKESHSFERAVVAAKERARVYSVYYRQKEEFMLESVCQKIRDSVALDGFRQNGGPAKSDETRYVRILESLRFSAGLESFAFCVQELEKKFEDNLKRALTATEHNAIRVEAMDRNRMAIVEKLGPTIKRTGEIAGTLNAMAKSGKGDKAAVQKAAKKADEYGKRVESAATKAFSRISEFAKTGNAARIRDYYKHSAELETAAYLYLKTVGCLVGLKDSEREWMANFEKEIDSHKLHGTIAVEALPYCPDVFRNFKASLKELGVDISFDYHDEGEKEPAYPLEFQLANLYGKSATEKRDALDSLLEEYLGKKAQGCLEVELAKFFDKEVADKGREELLAAQVALRHKCFPEGMRSDGKILLGLYVREKTATAIIQRLSVGECKSFFDADLAEERRREVVAYYPQQVGRYLQKHQDEKATALADYLETEAYLGRMSRRVEPKDVPADAVPVEIELLDGYAGGWLLKTGRKAFECLVDDADNNVWWKYHLGRKDYDELVGQLKAEFEFSKNDAVLKALVIALKREEKPELVDRLRKVWDIGVKFSESQLEMTKEEFERMASRVEQEKHAKRREEFAVCFSYHCDDPALAYLRKFIFTEIPQFDGKRETDKIAIRILQSLNGSWERKMSIRAFDKPFEAALDANPEKEKVVVDAYRKAELLNNLWLATSERTVNEFAEEYGDVLLRAANSEEGVPFRVIAGEFREKLPNLAAMQGKMHFELEAVFLSEMKKADFASARQEKIMLMRESNVDDAADRKLIERALREPVLVRAEKPKTDNVKAGLTPQAESATLRMELNAKLAQCKAMNVLRQGEEEAFHQPNLKWLYKFYREKDIRAFKKELPSDDAVRLKLLEIRMSELIEMRMGEPKEEKGE